MKRIKRAFKTVFLPSHYCARGAAEWEQLYYLDVAPIVRANMLQLFRHPSTTAFYGLVLLESGALKEGFRVVDWLASKADDEGRVWIDAPVPRRFARIEGPWYSAMAQGLGVSFISRLASVCDSQVLRDTARRFARSLFSSIGQGGCLGRLGANTPFPEELCALPETHVLNGAVFGYWGMRDFVCADLASPSQRETRRDVLEAIVSNLSRFRLGRNWSLYDLHHRIIASREYHRLHAAQAYALALEAKDCSTMSVAHAWNAGDRMWRAGWYAAKKALRECAGRYVSLEQ